MTTPTRNITDEEFKTVARACGLEVIRMPNALKPTWLIESKDGKSVKGLWMIETPPNYDTDIDAMQTALAKQPEDFNSRFSSGLAKTASERDVFVHQLTAQDWFLTFLGMLPKPVARPVEVPSTPTPAFVPVTPTHPVEIPK